jgi:Tol biopolymer transport system component/DNA-binding winged helix-turn-helix (wHTH) protein
MAAEVFDFGDVTLDLRRVEVRRAGEIVSLEPKSFDVLRHLVENHDRLVTKEELLEVVWRDTFVTPNVLTRAIAQLRKGLGDDAFEARYIETVARRGYRFIGAVGMGGNGNGGSHASTAGLPVAHPPRAEAPQPARRLWVRVAAMGLAAAGVLGAAAGLWRAALSPVAPAGEATLLTPRRVTAARDRYGTPAVSPDGHSVAYVSDRTGSAEIYVASLAPGSRELPITADGGGNVDPAFSPDGQWLAYRSAQRGGLWVVPSTGGTPRRVADFGSDPSWSPDNRTIAFTSLGGLSSQALLWTVRVDGSTPVPLTRLGDPPGGHLSPTWSHDGRWIAFRVGKHEANEAWAVDAGGGAPRRLATLTRSSEPRFSPDDRAIYFFGKTTDKSDCLMRLRLDGAVRPDGDPEMVLAFQGEGTERLSIARDGTAVFLWNRLSVNLWAVDVEASVATGPPRQLTFDDEAISRYPDYAADGRVAYEQLAAGRPVTAWVMDDEGQNKEALSLGLPVSVRWPQWDLEGKRVLALVEPGKDLPPYFGWIDLSTRQLRRIPVPSPGTATQPSLSPDGRRLAFHLVAPDGTVNVWVQDLDGGARRQVTFDPEAISYPRWSQDGRWLAVNVKRGEDTQVGVVSAGGGPVEQLTSGRGIRWPYTFSPDNDWVAFAGGLDSTAVWNVSVVSRTTREVRPLTHFTTTGGARFPAWSPRGNRIVFSRPESFRSLWTVKLPS